MTDLTVKNKGGFFEKMAQGLARGLAKTRDALAQGLKAVFSAGATSDKALDQLADALLGADIGVVLTERLISRLKEAIDKKEIVDEEALKSRLKQEIKEILTRVSAREKTTEAPPHGTPIVTLYVGINGVGKTTTIGKVAHRLRQEGKTVLLGAGDTFRAGAILQLSIWGERIGADVICSKPGADPSSVAFDAVHAARARGVDHLLIDTAGRLQTNYNLMEEIKKIKRVVAKVDPTAPHQQILVLDAVTGQNALSQARQFHEALGLTGIILTKLDTTARGGVLVSIVDALQLPVIYAGVGEGVDDLLPFQIDSYVDALFEGSS